MHKTKCGQPDEKPEVTEIVCTILGCERCKEFNGTVYYRSDLKKGIEMIVKEHKNMDNKGE